MSSRVQRDDARIDRKLADLAEEVRGMRQETLALGSITSGLATTVEIITTTNTDSIRLAKTAGVTLSGHRAVVPQADGTVIYADNATLGHCTRPIWLTLGAAIVGTDVTVLAFGEASDGSWSWTAGLPIFLGANGVLTQTPPTGASAAFIMEIAGTVRSPDGLFFDPRNPIAF